MFRKIVHEISHVCFPIAYLHAVYGQDGIVMSRRPKNTATLAGTNATLNCQFDITGHEEDNVEWQLLGIGVSPVRISYNTNISTSAVIVERGGTQKYRVDLTVDGQLRDFDLHINHTNSADNLYHQCRAIRDDVSASALVLVLGRI